MNTLTAQPKVIMTAHPKRPGVSFIRVGDKLVAHARETKSGRFDVTPNRLSFDGHMMPGKVLDREQIDEFCLTLYAKLKERRV